MIQQQKTKVLIFSVTYFPFVGGAEVALRAITKRLPHIEFDIITAKISQKLSNLEKIDQVNVYRVGSGSKLDKYLYPLRAFLFAKKLHQQKHYNLIWSMMATWAGIPALFFKLKFPSIKYLLTLQSGDSDLFIWLRTWFWYPLYRMIYRRADHIQVISNWLAQRARRYGYQGEISLVPNGVALESFQQSAISNQQSAIKRKLNIENNSKVIFTSSRLVKKNDIESLIKSIKFFSPNDKLQTKLIIAGSGKLEKKLKKFTQQLNLSDKVIFLGQLTPEELLSYYAIADIFVRPSLSEGQGISFIEAMAAGVPVIATPVGGIPDFLINDQTGWFCQVKNPESIAEKINYILNDKNKLVVDKVIQNAKKMVVEKYTWNLIAEQMNQVFNKLI